VAVTVFVTGHSYAAAGFSTSTTVWDTTTGDRVGELEDFDVTLAGDDVDAVDRNFWGVTFAGDGRTFYATMATAGRTHLVRGDLDTGRGEVLAEGVECPSLSPDETRVAFKQRRPGDAVSWTLAVLDLERRTRTVLPVDAEVDDQPYWLDDATVAYGAARGSTGEDASRQDTWTVLADGSAPPRLLREDAWSLVVDR
jgi:Tol biopolymer transport system component